MKPVLIYARPLDNRTGQRVDIRVADGPDANTYGIGGTPWTAALSVRPTLSIELMSPDMDGKVQAGQAKFEIAMSSLVADKANYSRYYWRGAEVVIHNTGALEGPTAVPDFWGYITQAVPDLETGRLSVTAQVSTAFLERDLLTQQFTGGGGINGDAGKRGVYFPVGFGVCKNIQPVFFDAARNIGMIDGYGNTLSIDWLGEGLNSLGPPVADYASYAALAAAIDAGQVPKGRWATCIAVGLIGLGAPPVLPITCHATFKYPRCGAIMKRLLLTHAAVPAARVDTAAFDALDGIVNRPVHFWSNEQRNVRELLEYFSQACNATPIVSFQNQVTVSRATTNPVASATLERSGRIDPRVLNWASGSVDPPYSFIRGRAARPITVLNLDDVLFSDTIVDRGEYVATTTYRAGNLVWLASGASYLYINNTATAGNAPPTTAPFADAYWQRIRQPQTGSDIGVANGATKNTIYRQSTTPSAPTEGDFWVDTSVTPNVVRVRLAGLWQQSATNVTQASDIGIVNGATRNVIYRQASAPDSPADGDFWVDTSVTPTVTRIRLAGLWQVASTAVTQGLDIGVANGATKNVIYRQSTTPTSPTDGDIWVDTSVTPVVVRVRQSGAWQIASNLVTTGTDIGVDNGATKNSNERALNRNSAFVDGLLGWTNRDGQGAIGSFASSESIRGGNVATMTSGAELMGEHLPCSPGETLYLAYRYRTAQNRSSGAGALWYFRIQFAPGVGQADVAVGGNVENQALSAEQGWQAGVVAIQVPAGCKAARVMAYLDYQAAGAGAIGYVDYGEIHRDEPGSDNTANNQVSIEMVTDKSITADYQGNVTGPLPVTFSPSVRKAGQSIKLDNSVGYAVSDVANGNVTVSNGNGAGDKGDVTVSAITANKCTFTLTIYVNGIAQAPLKCTLSKALSAPPTGSGSGGGGSTGSASVAANQSTQSTSYVPACSGANPTVVLTAGQKLYATYSGDYTGSSGTGGGGAPRSGYFLAEYSADQGQSWTAFGPAVNGTQATKPYVIPGSGGETNEGQNGHADVAFSVAGLAAGTYMGRLSFATSVSGRDVTLLGDPFTLEAKP